MKKACTVVLKRDIRLKLPNQFLEVKEISILYFILCHVAIWTTLCVYSDCGGNISNAEQATGIIQSENFPIKYEAPESGMATKSCHWYLNVKAAHQILINILEFTLEGNPACEFCSNLYKSVTEWHVIEIFRIAARGCSAAVLRLWLDMNTYPIEVCGEKPNNDSLLYVSVSNQARIRLVEEFLFLFSRL